jgi:hypothetical protein
MTKENITRIISLVSSLLSLAFLQLDFLSFLSIRKRIRIFSQFATSNNSGFRELA